MLARAILQLILGMSFAAGAERPDGTKVLPVVDKQDIRFVTVSAGGEGLNKWIKGITQDNQGFIWFATREGLFRYDGYTLKPYLHDPGNSNSVGSDDLSAIYKDRSGILWIGTADHGLDRLDPVSGIFTHYRHQPGADSSLSSDGVVCIYRDRSGTLWVGTYGGLDRLDASTGVFVHYKHNPQDPASLTDDAILAVYEDSHANLWIATAHGLNKLDRATGRSTHYLHDPKNPRSIASDYVGTIVEDRSGVLWVGSSVGGGLSALDPNTRESSLYSFYPEQPGRESNAGVTAMLADADGSLWLTTIDNGLLKLDPGRKEFSRYLNGQTTRIFEDAEGVMWIGTRTQGVLRFLRKSPAFVNYESMIDPLRQVRKNEIQSVGADSRGFLWIGMTNGVEMLDRTTVATTRYQHDAKNPYSISNAPVFSIAEDRSGRMWFGTYGAGLDRFDRATGRFYSYRHDPKNPDSLSSDRILSILVDRDGMLWVGTEGGGLDRFVPGTGNFKNYHHDPSDSHSLSSNRATALFEDSAGTLWVGGEGWLDRFDRKYERFSEYRDDGDRSKAAVRSIHRDRRGTLWLGTEGGLARLEPSGHLTYLTTKDGLPDGNVKAILEDRNGDLWLATHHGLAHFSPHTGRFQNYFESDGLPSNTFDLLGNAAGQTPRGEMEFGSSHGVTVFDPERVSANSYVPPVALTDFLLFNRPVSPGPNSALRKPISATDALTLNHDQSIFTVEFAALSYVDPERNRYRFRLEPLENDWNVVDSKRRVATYISLPPGTYTFQVQGSNNDQVWNDAGARLAITVLPPWYATWWFTTAFLICVAGMLLAAHRVRMRSLRLTASRLELEVAERTLELNAAKESADIARNAAEAANRAKSAFLSHMSHELRTPLNAILGFARLLREDTVTEKQRADLDIIHRSGEHLLGLINDVLDIAKIEAGRTSVEIAPCDLGRLVRDVTDMMSPRAAEKNLELRLVQPSEVPQFVETDAKKLREMLINLLENAIRHTGKGSVTLRVEEQKIADPAQVLLIFEVRDTGIGIASEDQERIFEPFVQVGKEMRQKGTGLGLAITRQFAALLGGSVRVSSALGGGSVFRLEIPVKLAEPVATDPDAEREYVLAMEQEYRILVVDDDPENRRLLEQLLLRAGFQVRVAEDGVQAIEMFRSWRPHFIWMDLRMPEVDGAEAAQRIRKLEGGQDVRISAVTASEHTHSTAGMDDLIHKPYRAREIFECMSRHLGVIYRSDDAANTPSVEAAGTLRPEALAVLPNDLRAELTNAVISLNISRITQLVRRVSELDPVLGAALQFHADRFAFTNVLQALKDSESLKLTD